jgi:ATP-binding cassette subfamily B protein IrtB
MIRALLRLMPAGSRPRVALHLALTVLGVVARAAGAVLLVPLVAALFGPDPRSAWGWVGLLAVVTASGWALDAWGAAVGYELGFGLLDSGQRTVAERVARIRLTWFTTDNTATARQSIAATGPELVGVIIYLVTPVLGALLLPIAIGLALLLLAPPLGVAALAGVPVLWGAYWVAGRLGRGADDAAATANAALTERIVEFARTQGALRAARRVGPERSLVGAALEAQHGATLRLVLMQVPGQVLFSLASQAALLGLAGTTVWLAAADRVTVPEAIALIVVRYLEPYTVLAELSGGVESTTGMLRRLRDVLSAPTVTDGGSSWTSASAPRIELRGVGFGYGGGAPRVLDGLDLAFEPGTTTAIVGPSGSGKSTILSLLAGLHEPVEGSVLLDGVDTATLTTEARRRVVSAVFQQPFLFDGSVRDNVLVGGPHATAEELATVGELARVDAVVGRSPNGWDTRVGEGGATLSGGERQRVSIARALLKPAPVLLVDEATSALDTENESAIADALLSDPVPRTRVVVAHRLTSIRAADRVLFVDDGRIVEDGGVDELLAAGGRFAEFWSQQHAASAWRL